jgi:hypothetical protein
LTFSPEILKKQEQVKIKEIIKSIDFLILKPKSFLDSNVYLTMFGEEIESEEIFLEDSETHQNKFERNHMDRFRVSSYDLGDLNAIRVRHDNAGLFPGWFLDRVEITTEDERKYVFVCNKWFSLNIDDGKIDRVIKEIVRVLVKKLEKYCFCILFHKIKELQ